MIQLNLMIFVLMKTLFCEELVTSTELIQNQIRFVQSDLNRSRYFRDVKT